MCEHGEFIHVVQLGVLLKLSLLVFLKLCAFSTTSSCARQNNVNVRRLAGN